jgi:hypothetical protein
MSIGATADARPKFYSRSHDAVIRVYDDAGAKQSGFARQNLILGNYRPRKLKSAVFALEPCSL